MSKKNQQASAKRAAKAAALGLTVSGTTLEQAPAAPMPPAAPQPVESAVVPQPPAPPAPLPPAPLPAYTGNTPPAHFTPEDIALGQDPDGTWVAQAIVTARILNAHAQVLQQAKEAGVQLPGTAKRYVSKTDPNSKYHNRDRSTAQKPVQIVHSICAANPGLSRKAVIELCIAQGVNKNTAATQYSMFQLKKKNA